MMAMPGGERADDLGQESHAPEAAEIVGTYDLTVTAPRGGEPALGVGWVADGDDLYVQLTVPAVALQGTLRRDGTLVLAGVTTGSDVALPVSATGRVRARDGVHRIELAIGGPTGDDTRVVMERPVDADLRGAHGRFRLDFEGPRASGCAGTVTLAITVPLDATGSAYLDTTPVLGADEQAIAELRGALVDVAPSGRFHLEAEYVAGDGFDPAGVIGTTAQLQVDGRWPLGPNGTMTTGRYALLSSFRTQIERHDLTITRIE